MVPTQRSVLVCSLKSNNGHLGLERLASVFHLIDKVGSFVN